MKFPASLIVRMKGKSTLAVKNPMKEDKNQINQNKNLELYPHCHASAADPHVLLQ